jgi:hypothetical protein
MIRHYYFIIFTCHPFQSSPISLLRVVLLRSVLLLMLQNYKKKMSWHLIDRQLSVLNANEHAYSHPSPPLCKWGLNLDLNGIERVIIYLSVPEKYGFQQDLFCWGWGIGVLSPWTFLFVLSCGDWYFWFAGTVSSPYK